MRIFALGFAALFLAPLSVQAQQQVDFPADKDFLHEATGMIFPAKIGEASRQRITNFGDENFYNLGTGYDDRSSGVLTSYYIYRPANTDPAVNIESVIERIALREGYDIDKDAKLAPIAFAAPGRDVADSLRMTWGVAHTGGWISGGLALIPVDDYLLKVRISSSVHDEDQMHALLEQAVAHLAPPPQTRPSVTARRAAPCQTALETQTALRLQPTQDNTISLVLTMAVLGTDINLDDIESDENETVEKAKDETPALWCRDMDYPNATVFRADENTHQYLIGISDSGRYLHVGGIHSGGIIGAISSELFTDEERIVPVYLSNSERTHLIALLDGLPTPYELQPLLSDTRSLGSTDRTGSIALVTFPEEN